MKRCDARLMLQEKQSGRPTVFFSINPRIITVWWEMVCLQQQMTVKCFVFQGTQKSLVLDKKCPEPKEIL